jgi:hypothetical protein
MTTAFIHIGKTGGTTMNILLCEKLTNYKEYHHTNIYQDNEKYIIWLRNPISRYVSAFNHSYYGVTIDKKSIKSFDLKNCLIPVRIQKSLNKTYVFSPKYDELIKTFKNANHLAESLTSSDSNLQKKAKELMNSDDEHLSKGIGYYLNNGKFIETNYNNILFVGKLETMKEDINKLSIKLDVELKDDVKFRENIYLDKSMKYLSPLAIKNIINWYKDTDYLALQVLLKYGWINQEVLSSYYVYNNE